MMKNRKKERTSVEKPENSKKTSKLGKIFQVFGIIAFVVFVAYFALYYFAVVSPVKTVEKTHKEQTELLQEIIDRTPPTTVLKTNAELQTITDDELFVLVANLGDNSAMLADFDNSFAKFAESLLADYDSKLKYEQLTSLADYARSYCGTSDMTTLNLTGILTDYMCDLAAISFMYKAMPAMDDLYGAKYDAYNSMETHVEMSSPLQLENLVVTMVKDSDVLAEMLSKCTSVNRAIQAEYSTLKAQYNAQFGSSPNINGMFFDTNAQSVDDLIDLRMLACDEFLVTGVYLPMNISAADSALIDEARAKAREKLIACNRRFNMTADGDTVKGFDKFLQNFAVSSVNKVYDKIADYNTLELHSYLHSPLKFTEQHIKRYNREYVFWNLMLSVLTFNETTTYGTPVANLNYKLGTIDYGIIDGGNFIFEESELDSLLWATAEQQILSHVYSNCKISFDESGNIVAEDTNDELVAAYRNWFEAWNLWGSQYTQ